VVTVPGAASPEEGEAGVFVDDQGPQNAGSYALHCEAYGASRMQGDMPLARAATVLQMQGDMLRTSEIMQGDTRG
jgi:hypothetical protein